MISLRKVYHAKIVHLSALLLTLFFSLTSLVSCNQPAPPQYTSISLGIPAAALQSPVKGPLPASTLLYVGVTFKIDPRLLDQAHAQKLQPGQSSSQEQFGNLSVSFPASDPWAVSVGGTELSVNDQHNRTDEVAWSNGLNPFYLVPTLSSTAPNARSVARCTSVNPFTPLISSRS